MNNSNIKGFQFLVPNHTGTLKLKTGRIINYGVVRLYNESLVRYTAKGLREIWKQEMNEEQKERAQELKNILEQEGGEERLIQSDHIAITHFEDIDHVIS